VRGAAWRTPPARRAAARHSPPPPAARRTRRTWKPNAQTASLFSDILGRRIRLRVTTAALRSIDKAGGLDRYVLDTDDGKLDSARAVELKVDMLQALLRRQGAAQASGMLPLAAAAVAGEGAAVIEAPATA
jgi:large subunit ribosomal protein L28